MTWMRWNGWPNSEKRLAIAFGLAIYGTFVNWGVTLLSGFWGAGGAMMPIAAKGFEGTSRQEMVISFGLTSLSLAMVAVCVMVLVGLRHKAALSPEEGTAPLTPEPEVV